MSCVSSNFSSFFLNSLNDSSEFAKYLSNGELKFSPFEELQVFNTPSAQQQSTPPQQQQQQPQQQIVNGSGAFYNGGSHCNNNNNNVTNASTAHSGTEAFANNGVTGGGVVGGVAAGSGLEVNNYTHPTLQAHPPPHASAALPHHHHQHHPAQTNPHAIQQPHHPPTLQQQQQQHHFGTQPPAPAGGVNMGSFHHNHHHHQQLHSTVVPLPPPPPPSNNSISSNNTPPTPQSYNTPQRWPTAALTPNGPTHLHNHPHPHPHLQHHPQHHMPPNGAQHFDGSFEFLKYLRHSNDYNEATGAGGGGVGESSHATPTSNNAAAVGNSAPQVQLQQQPPPPPLPPQQQQQLMAHQQHPPQQPQQQQQQQGSSLIDLDSSTNHKSRSSSRKVAALLSSVSRTSVNSLDSSSSTLDVFDHDSKHTIFELHQMTNSSNSNESSLEMSNLAFPGSHLNASNSNTSSEGAAAGNPDFTMLNSAASNAPKPLATFTIKENFDVHPSHKVEEGIFQHMNKLPTKKKENLKQLGVRFTGQMTLSDKMIIVENFIKFCHEYDVQDHRPFLSLNQSGLNKPEQIKFARYLGQGLPTFTLFCIYSNFKNLFCTKRTEIYTKDGYNLPYILDKTKRFLANTTADLKNLMQQQSKDGIDFALHHNHYNNNNNTSINSNPTNAELAAAAKCQIMPKVLENLVIYENFDVHETHRVEDGVCTHITRLPQKKQELFKQFGIQSNQPITYYEKYMIVENFIRFCNEYKIADHRPFLDFHESGLPKCEQVKFVRYLGQGLPNLTLNKIYLSFKDVLGLNRIEKITLDGYNLELILKKKKKILYNRMHATVLPL